MGIKQTKALGYRDGYPKRYYEACAKAEEGCYTVSELYFNQAIERHPGHAFWSSMMDVTVPKKERSGDAEELLEPGSPGGELDAALVSRLPDAAACSSRGVFRQGESERFTRASSGQHGTEGEDSSGFCTPFLEGDAASVASKQSERDPTLVFPVDRRLEDLQSYVCMLSDIACVYRRKSAASDGESCEMARNLSLMYNSYTAVRLQVMMHLLQTHFAQHNADGGKQGEDMFGVYCRSCVNNQAHAPLHRNNANPQLASPRDPNQRFEACPLGQRDEAEVHAHDDAICVFWQSLLFLFAANLQQYAITILRVLRSPGGDKSPANTKMVFDISLKCFEAVRKELARTAEINSHNFIGALVKDFAAVLERSAEECVLGNEASAALHQRNKEQKHKRVEARYLHLGSSPSFSDAQVNFFRLAKHFTGPSIPLLDVSALTPVELELQVFANSYRAVKLITPLDRNSAWYMSADYSSLFEKDPLTAGNSKYLLTKCGVPSDATIRDWSMFLCAGMEELSIGLLYIALGTAIVIQALGKMDKSLMIRDAALQFVLNLYGCPTTLSDFVGALFLRIVGEAAV